MKIPSFSNSCQIRSQFLGWSLPEISGTGLSFRECIYLNQNCLSITACSATQEKLHSFLRRPFPGETGRPTHPLFGEVPGEALILNNSIQGLSSILRLVGVGVQGRFAGCFRQGRDIRADLRAAAVDGCRADVPWRLCAAWFRSAANARCEGRT